MTWTTISGLCREQTNVTEHLVAVTATHILSRCDHAGRGYTI